MMNYLKTKLKQWVNTIDWPKLVEHFAKTFILITFVYAFFIGNSAAVIISTWAYIMCFRKVGKE